MLSSQPQINMSHPQVVVPDQFNVTTAFLDRHLNEGRSDKVAVYYEGKTYTYANIAELANRVGNALLDLNVDIEQRVALLLLDSPQFAAAFFGAIKIGAVPIPINTVLRPEDYAYILNDSRARLLIVHVTLWQAIQHVRPLLKYLRHIVVVNNTGAGFAVPQHLHDFELWTNQASATFEAAE